MWERGVEWKTSPLSPFSSPPQISQDHSSFSLAWVRGCSAQGIQSTMQGEGQLPQSMLQDLHPLSPSPCWCPGPGLHSSSSSAGTGGPHSRNPGVRTMDADIWEFSNETAGSCILPFLRSPLKSPSIFIHPVLIFSSHTPVCHTIYPSA